MNALERLAGTYESQGASARKELAIAEGQLRDYQARLGKRFAHDAYLGELAGLRDQLKAALSESRPESGAVPPAREIAERIQALRCGQAIEPAPERIGKRREHAEAPVTSRIRERRGSAPHQEPETDQPSPPVFRIPSPGTDHEVFLRETQPLGLLTSDPATHRGDPEAHSEGHLPRDSRTQRVSTGPAVESLLGPLSPQPSPAP